MSEFQKRTSQNGEGLHAFRVWLQGTEEAGAARKPQDDSEHEQGWNRRWAASTKIRMWLVAPASSSTLAATTQVGTRQVISHLQCLPAIPCKTVRRALVSQCRMEGAGSSVNEHLQPSLSCIQCTACIQVMNNFFPKKWAQVKNSLWI